MRRSASPLASSVFATAWFAGVASAASAIIACSSSASPNADPNGGGTNTDDASGGSSGSTGETTKGDASTGQDGASDDDSGDGSNGPPAVRFVGRFDESDPSGKQMAWPGSRIVARFDGTAAKVKLSRTWAGYQGGPSWLNVIVDGVVKEPFSVSGLAEEHDLASDLAPGTHTVELEKRTEANHGTVRFEGFTFSGGSGLLSPPARPTRRIELIAESTIDGFGVEGDKATTCIGTAPPQFDNVRKSLAWFTSTALGAEMHLSAYSGKGVASTTSGLGSDPFTMPLIFSRALVEPNPGTAWTFSSWTPDVIVISLGGVDYKDGVSGAPGNFQSKYEEFIASLRTAYGAAPHIWMTVWSQIKNSGGNLDVRSAISTKLDGVVATRAGLGDAKVHKFVFPEANGGSDETGCYGHASAAHHEAMAALLTAEIKSVTGW